MQTQLNELRRHLAKTLKPVEEVLAEPPPAEEKASAKNGNGGPPPAKAGASEEELAAAKVYPFYLANQPVSSINSPSPAADQRTCLDALST